MRWPLLLLPFLALTGCTRLRGVVLDDPTGRPARNAVISVGNPSGIAIYDVHHVDDNGEFDFLIGPTDDNNLYLYDGSASPELTARRVGQFELSDHMRLYLHRATPGTPSLPPGAAISPF